MREVIRFKSIEEHSTISLNNRIVFGNDVLTGPHVFVADHNHAYDYTEMAILMTPLFIYLFVVFFKLIGAARKVFLIFGKHSMNMWLVHSFFCYYYFQKEMLIVSTDAFVDYALLVGVSFLSSIIVCLILGGIYVIVNRMIEQLKKLKLVFVG